MGPTLTNKDILRLSFMVQRFVSPHWLYKFLVRLVAPCSRVSVAELRDKNLFLVTSTGRTGTLWLSQLLRKDPRAIVEHEPVPYEQIAHLRAMQDPSSIFPYIERFRVRSMAHRCKGRVFQSYGEVNGALRRHIPALRASFPRMKFVHIIRNPETYIESVMQRDTLTSRDVISRIIFPPRLYFSADEWGAMSRFEKICWLWKVENSYMAEHCDVSYRFEDLIQSAQEIKDLVQFIGLDVSSDDCASMTNLQVNKTERICVNKETIWTPDNKEIFQKYCADLMNYFGYPGARFL